MKIFLRIHIVKYNTAYMRMDDRLLQTFFLFRRLSKKSPYRRGKSQNMLYGTRAALSIICTSEAHTEIVNIIQHYNIFHVRYVKRQILPSIYFKKIFIFPFDWFFLVVIHLWCWWSAIAAHLQHHWSERPSYFPRIQHMNVEINEYKWCHITQNHKLSHFHFSVLCSYIADI